MPAASVAVHVTMVVPTGNPLAGALFVTETTPTASVANGGISETTVFAPVASVYTSASGVPVITGATVSDTVTVAVTSVAAFPAVSVAVNVTVVVPIGKVVGALLLASPTPSTASDVFAAFKNAAITAAVLAIPAAEVASAVILAGALIIGAVISTVYVMAVDAVLVLPATSVAVAVKLCAPSVSVAPPAKLQLPPVAVTMPSDVMPSFTFTEAFASAIPEMLGRAVTLVSTLCVGVTITGIFGASVSSMIESCANADRLPAASLYCT